MNRSRLILVVAAAAIAGCAAGSGAGPEPAPSGGPLGSPFGDRQSACAYPLFLDPGDLRLGTTVQFPRMPSPAEISDLTLVRGLQHVLIVLPQWPPEFAPLSVLEQLPEESDAIVVLPGYPPSRAAANAWNLVNARLRIVIVVRDVPPSAAVVSDLNGMRSLERVIAEMETPGRVGFERLQRPLSFRVLRE